MDILVQEADRTVTKVDATALSAMLPGKTAEERAALASRILKTLHDSSTTMISRVALDEIVQALRATGTSGAIRPVTAIIKAAHGHHPPLPPLPPPPKEETGPRPPEGHEEPPEPGETPPEPGEVPLWSGEIPPVPASANCFWGMCTPRRCAHFDHKPCKCSIELWEGEDPTTRALDEALRALRRLEEEAREPAKKAKEAARALDERVKEFDADAPDLKDLLSDLIQQGATQEELEKEVRKFLESTGVDQAQREQIEKALPELLELAKDAKASSVLLHARFDRAIAIDLAKLRASMQLDKYPQPSVAECFCEWSKYIRLLDLRRKIELLEARIAAAEADMPSFFRQLINLFFLIAGNVVGAIASLASANFTLGVFSWELVDFFLDATQAVIAIVDLGLSLNKVVDLTTQVIADKIELSNLLLEWYDVRHTSTSHGLR